MAGTGAAWAQPDVAQAASASAPDVRERVTHYTIGEGESLNDVAALVTQSSDPAVLLRASRALFEANPKAFMKGDLNRVKIGAVLNVPALDAAGRTIAAASGKKAEAAAATKPHLTVGAPVVAQTAMRPPGAASAVRAASTARTANTVLASPTSAASSGMATPELVWPPAASTPVAAFAAAAKAAASQPAAASASIARSPQPALSTPNVQPGASAHVWSGAVRPLKDELAASAAAAPAPVAAPVVAAPAASSAPAPASAPAVSGVPADKPVQPKVSSLQQLLEIKNRVLMELHKHGIGAKPPAAPALAQAAPARAVTSATSATSATAATVAHRMLDRAGIPRRHHHTALIGGVVGLLVVLLLLILLLRRRRKRAAAGQPVMDDAQHDAPKWNEAASGTSAVLAGAAVARQTVPSDEASGTEAAEGPSGAGPHAAGATTATTSTEMDFTPDPRANMETHASLSLEGISADFEPNAESAAPEAFNAPATQGFEAAQEAIEQPGPVVAEAVHTPSVPLVPLAQAQEVDANAEQSAASEAGPTDATAATEPAGPVTQTAPAATPPMGFPLAALEALDSLDMPLPPRAQPAESASEAPASGAITGLGAARFGVLNLDFDLELPSDPVDALPAFTAEDLGKIARNKLDLAVEYIELGDLAGARALVYEVIEANDAPTREDAYALLATLEPHA
ncbi:FimV/HubP family polar landmark protein [Paraburkholderia hayleyella]|uniref:FimV/HubP family polar landmark protein n=1 Tax=Paraburkholderia hayleyella TaxID=2152889 RepID=UPI0015811F4E|nr:FimV/HubP family polar landmark protein [Paraburkholderia hayleyella]